MPSKAPRYQPLPKITKVHTVVDKQNNYGQGRGGRPWRRLREKVLQRDGYLCQCDLCKNSGLPLLADEVDHIIPLAQGGSNELNNLQALNHIHHRIKTRKEMAKISHKDINSIYFTG